MRAAGTDQGGADPEAVDAERLNRVGTAAGVAGGLLAGISLATQLGQAAIHHQYVALSVLAAVALFVLWTIYRICSSPKRQTPIKTRTFQPFVGAAAINVWPRSRDIENLLRQISSQDSHVVLVVGDSGVGKTVLVRRALLETLRNQGIQVAYRDTYTAFGSDIASGSLVEPDKRSSGRPQTDVVVILDQFEQYIATTAGDSRALPTLKALIQTLRAAKTRVVLVIRPEWYFNLHPLGELIPAPDSCVIIRGPSGDPLGADDDTARAIVRDFEVIAKDAAAAAELVQEVTKDGRLLPVEVQIVGAQLERRRTAGALIDASYLKQALKGARGAIEEFFSEVLAGANDQRIALKVLFALSVQNRFRTQQDLNTILARLYEHPARVREAVGYLTEQGLLVERGVRKYELAHDYLAAYFQRRSGSGLNPSDRDNILYHFEGTSDDSGLVQSGEKIRTDRFARWVVGPLFVLMCLRMLGFGIDWSIPLATIRPDYAIGGALIDKNYLPIFIAHAAWATYIFLFYERVFARLNRVNRSASRAIVANMAVCVFVAMLIPESWLADIGWGGLVIGIRVLSLSVRRDINPLASATLRDIGRKTAINLAIVLAIGVAGILLTERLVNSPTRRLDWLLVNLFLSMVVTYAAMTLMPTHVGEEAAASTLGLLARSGSGVISVRGTGTEAV